MIVLTLAVQVSLFSVASDSFRKTSHWIGKGAHRRKRVIVLFCLTLWLLAGIFFAACLWSFLYLRVGEFQALEQALYFCMVVFTTLGFGDIVLSENWRLSSAVMAANGLILFSLNTALLIDMMRRLENESE